MRPRFLVAALVALVFVSLAPPTKAEASRTLRIEIPASATRFAIENLSGTMRIVPGSGETAVAVATVRAESEDLAASVRFEQVNDASGVSTFRVRYPYDRHTRFRYPGLGPEEGVSSWVGGLFGSGTTTTYDGHRVRVSSSSGVLLYADVEVQVPRRPVDAAFRNVVGRLEAREVEGKFLFDTGGGDIALDRVKGEIKTDAGSGHVKATGVEGSFACDVGSGDCELTGFHGETVDCDAGSGTIRLKSVAAHRITTDTGSGDVHAMDVDAEEVDFDAGSGDIELSAQGTRLARVTAETGSGDLTLKLGPDASFEAVCDQGSGDIANRYADAQPIVKGKEVVGYRRGTGQTHIRFEAGSGDLTLEP